VQSADNQQERLISIGWVIGFVDGEGCFSVGVVRQPDRPGRRGYTTGYQVFHEFAVTQGARSVHCMEKLRTFFGVGAIYLNTRYDNHREHLYRYCVRRRADLLGVIIPFFRSYPLQTAKVDDFEKFAVCVERIAEGHHLNHSGLADIIEISSTMNRQKPRTELIRILRDHTPGPETSGEDMVRTAWRHAGRQRDASAQTMLFG
jgi:LAGLIDADG endonuclease